MILNNVDSILSSFVSFQYSYLLFFFFERSFMSHWNLHLYLSSAFVPHLILSIAVKSESEVAQPCLTLCDPMDCSLPGSSIHGIFEARTLESVVNSSPGDLPTQGSNPGLPHRRQEALLSEPPGESSWTGRIAGQGIIYIHLFECLSFVWSFYLIFHSF